MNLDDYKTIIKGAIANEVEARKFYEDAAAKIENPGLKEMFASLAEEEKKHRDILTHIYSSGKIQHYFDESLDYKVSETVDEPELSFDMKPADAIALAMKKEEDAMNQYTEMANLCSDAEKKKVFMDLATMERAHKLKMENAFVDIGYPEVW